MDLFRHVLVATDFSEPASWALASGAGIAQSMGAQLTLVAVVQPYRPGTLAQSSLTGAPVETPFLHEAETELKKLRDAHVPDGVGVRLEALVDLSPAGALTDAAEEWGADLIVLGTRGQGGFRRLLLGSVAEQVVRHAPCPVLTLGRAAFADSARQNGIAVAVELTEGDDPALDAAESLADAFGVPLTAVHVVTDESARTEAEKRLAGLRKIRQRPELRCEVLHDDDPIEAVVAFAERTKPELLVVATHGRTGLRRTLLGSVSEHVVREAPCPVLTVRRQVTGQA